MNRRTLLIGMASISVIGIVAALTLFFAKPASFRGTAYVEPYPPATGIELTQANGDIFRLSDQKGKIVLLFFGYTFCPDVCPITLAQLKVALDELHDEAKFVRVVFISVDPGRDTPQRMQEYAARFNPTFIGLSGSQAELEIIWNKYGIFRQVVPGTSAETYTVDHTARVTLIDQQGNLRLSYGFQTPPQDIAHDIQILLKNR